MSGETRRVQALKSECQGSNPALPFITWASHSSWLRLSLLICRVGIIGLCGTVVPRVVGGLQEIMNACSLKHKLHESKNFCFIH